MKQETDRKKYNHGCVLVKGQKNIKESDRELLRDVENTLVGLIFMKDPQFNTAQVVQSHRKSLISLDTVLRIL